MSTKSLSERLLRHHSSDSQKTPTLLLSQEFDAGRNVANNQEWPALGFIITSLARYVPCSSRMAPKSLKKVVKTLNIGVNRFLSFC